MCQFGNVVVLLLCILSCFDGNKALAQEERATIGLTKLLGWYNELLGTFDTSGGWWITGNCLTTVLEYALKTHNTSFGPLIENMYLKNGFPRTETAGYDDIQWWGLAMIDAYKLTQKSAYLSRAEEIFKEATGAWSTDCGGGVWWDRKKTYKNAITNELFLSLAAELYLATNNSQYATWASEEWKWFNSSGLINSIFLINDGLTSSCRNNGQTTWTYNQGVILGGLVAMFNITQDKTYLDTASKIANAAIKNLSSNGTLQESCEPTNDCNTDQTRFKGIFIRNLAYLATATQDQVFKDYIANNAQSIWELDRSEAALGLKWGGPFDTQDASRQSSAVDALIAAIP
jgi:predicted alpha-1,6-mannanase (GH76 family)